MATLQIPEQITPKFQRLIDDTKSLENIRLGDAIPKELYQPRVWRGMLSFFTGYVVYISALIAISQAHWSLYLPLWLLAGLGGWGLFTVAHDCGHNSFSRNRNFNFFIGHISLIPLLYPFHGWRHMHNMHHSNTNNLEMDTDWRPVTRPQYDRMSRWQKFVYSSTRSWMFWLGTVNYQRHSGFNPTMFVKSEARNEVRRSILFIVVVAAVGLSTLIYFTGIGGFFLYFLGPWVCIHAWFSMTTMLHHISDETPFLTKEYWTFNNSRLLLTTDYMYSKWLLFLTNYISVHTAHHVAPIIPHYNLLDAQSALKKAFPNMLREKPLRFHDIWRVARYYHLYNPVTGYYEAFDHASQQSSSNQDAAFVERGPRSLKASLLQGYIRILTIFSVKAAGRKAADMFGHTRSLIKALPKDIAPIGSQYFPIKGVPNVSQGYLWGKGPGTVLLVHGWGANSSSMYSFTNELRKKGFRVAAFDAPAHGVSSGNLATMTEFKNSVKEVITSLDDVVGIVAHSLGSIAAVGALAELVDGHKVRSICLLGAPESLPAVIQRWSQQVLSLSPEVVDAMCLELWARNGVPVEHWSIPTLSRGLNISTLVLHASNDQVVPVCEAEAISEQLSGAILEVVDGLGHVRILSDAQVVERVVRFLWSCQSPSFGKETGKKSEKENERALCI